MTTIYSKALWRPLASHSIPGTLAQRNKIVLHITDGSTAEGAISWFAASVKPNRISANFVIDRDEQATVYQLADVADTTFHAHTANASSVAIEHVAIAGKVMATEAQYQASAELVAWLCRLLNIPCDRQHILEHCEADPETTHKLCCHGALDPDRVVAMAAAILSPPQT